MSELHVHVAATRLHRVFFLYKKCVAGQLIAATQLEALGKQHGCTQMILFQLSCLCGAYKASHSRMQPILWQTFQQIAGPCLTVMDKLHTDMEAVICVLKLARALAEGSLAHLNVCLLAQSTSSLLCTQPGMSLSADCLYLASCCPNMPFVPATDHRPMKQHTCFAHSYSKSSSCLHPYLARLAP